MNQDLILVAYPRIRGKSWGANSETGPILAGFCFNNALRKGVIGETDKTYELLIAVYSIVKVTIMKGEKMFKKITFVLLVLVLLLTTTTTAFADKPTGFDKEGKVTGTAADNGFDQWGYNRTARIFSGTGLSWCMEAGGSESACAVSMYPYANDKLVMKWNAEWDRGNDEGWSNPPYNAWENNEWNGMAPGGSGEVWAYKIVWVGPCGNNGDPVVGGGYCIWGQFAMILSQGIAGGEHLWDVLAKPAGYGAYYTNP